MSFVPDMHDLTGTYDASDVLTRMHTYFSVTSTKWQVNLIAGGGVGDGFVLESIVDGGYEIIFRRLSTSTINVSIQPGGGITDVGDTATPPTGTTAEFSSEQIWDLASAAAGSVLWLVEFDDAFFLMLTNTAKNNWLQCVHVGRIYVPAYPTLDVPQGRDGLGFLIGTPQAAAGGPHWFGTSTLRSRIRFATSIWYWPTSQSTNNSQSGWDDVAQHGYIRPIQLACSRTTDQGTCGIGPYRYIHRRGNTASPLQRYDLNNATDQAWIIGVGALMVPWRRSVSP